MCSESPLVSVIMPAYNAEKYILFAIDSILKQTYKNIELIIIEDCSTDSTLDLIKDISDYRIRIIKNDINMGVAFSTNIGLQEAKGKYIALHDDDDISDVCRIEAQIKYMESHKDIDILGTGFKFIDGYGEIKNIGHIPKNNPNYIKAMLLFKNLDFVNTSAMIKSDFILDNNMFYKENCYGMQDYYFYMRASKIGKISSLGDCLVYYRTHEKNFSKEIQDKYSRERALLYEKIRRESLELSGYNLEDYEFQVLNEALREGHFRVEDFKSWVEVVKVLRRILNQASTMKVDYYEELAIFIKGMAGGLLTSYDFLNDELIFN